MNQEIKDRIFAAADALFADSTTGDFPNVEAVRQKSRANMNYVVEALKEWRQRQRQSVQAVREPLPDQLRDTVLTMGHAIWETAQHLANDALEAARTAFEAEKADLAKLSDEQSEAFEALRTELETTQAKLETAETALARETEQNSRLQTENDQLRIDSEKQSARVTEITRRADDLSAELARVHAEFDAERQRYQQDASRLSAEIERSRSETEAARTAAAGEIETLRTELQQCRAELAATKTKAEAERDQLRKETADAREAAAALRGQLEAINAQNAALLAALKPAPVTPPAPGDAKK